MQQIDIVLVIRSERLQFTFQDVISQRYSRSRYITQPK